MKWLLLFSLLSALQCARGLPLIYALYVCVCVKQCRKQGSTEVAKENFHIGKSEQLGESGQMFSQFFRLIAGYLLSYMHKGPQ